MLNSTGWEEKFKRVLVEKGKLEAERLSYSHKGPMRWVAPKFSLGAATGARELPGQVGNLCSVSPLKHQSKGWYAQYRYYLVVT